MIGRQIGSSVRNAALVAAVVASPSIVFAQEAGLESVFTEITSKITTWGVAAGAILVLSTGIYTGMKVVKKMIAKAT